MTAPRRIFKIVVPVDDRWHPLDGVHSIEQILHVADQGNAGLVAVWFERDRNEYAFTRPPREIEARVYGTGHEIEDESAQYVGTAIAADGRLVWHLLAR